jgi:hypothetical protein
MCAQRPAEISVPEKGGYTSRTREVQREMAAQLDHGRQLAALIERAPDRLGGRFIDDEHQPSRRAAG